jgi:hypothetical protein
MSRLGRLTTVEGETPNALDSDRGLFGCHFNCGIFPRKQEWHFRTPLRPSCTVGCQRATNVNTGAKFETDSGETGLYKLNGLSAGTYELSISVTGAGDFVPQRIKGDGTKPVRFDIVLRLG